MDYKTLEMIFEDYKVYRPSSAEKAVKWYPSGRRMEIIVELNNGTYDVYDYLYKTTQSKAPSNNDELISDELYKQELKWYLRRAMNFAGMTQGELSKRTGITAVMISRYMNGKSIPSAWHLQRMADVLGCTMDELGYFR